MRSVLVVALAACSEPASMTDVGACDGKVVVEDDQGGQHVDVGTSITWTNNPPTTGPHYPIWASWNKQYAALDRGYYVHNAEHGGVVLLYRCDAGCPEVFDALLAVARNMADDSSCASALRHRVIVTADPLLPDGVQVAAVTWRHAYTASCYDPYVERFAHDHYNDAPEDTCADGASLGGTPIDGIR